MDLKTYLQESKRTAPQLGSGCLFVLDDDAAADLEEISDTSDVYTLADNLKRALFYRPIEEYALSEESTVPAALLEQNQMDLVHGILGIVSESGELAEAVNRHILEGEVLDRVNIVEEVGDVMWYLAMILRAVGGDFEKAAFANINKLYKRYPEKFDGSKAINRDTAVERISLESDLGQ